MATSEDLLTDSNLWVLANLDTHITSTDLEETPELGNFLNGAFLLSSEFTVERRPNWAPFMQDWSSNTKYIPWFNSLLPPHGTQDSRRCKNSRLQYQVDSGFFTDEDIKSMATTYWARCYDAMMAIGFAACAANPSARSSGADIFAALMDEVDYEGLANRMKFDNQTGTFDTNVIEHDLVNFVLSDDGKQIEHRVVDSVVGQESFNFSGSTAYVFRGGVGMEFLPPDVTPPEQNFNYLPLWAKVVGYLETFVVAICSIVGIVWVRVYRKERIVINSQGVLLQVVCLGCLIGSFSILMLTVDDTPGETMDPNVACQAAPTLLVVGLLLAFTALGAKMYRIFVVFNSMRYLKRRTASLNVALGQVALTIFVCLVLQVIWICVSPLYFERVVRTVDVNNYPLTSDGNCYGSDTSIALLGVSLFFVFAMLLGSSILASWIRRVPAEFQESKYVALTVMSMFQLFLVAVPAAIATYGTGIGKFVLLSTLVFVSLMLLLGGVVLPKALFLHWGWSLLESSDLNTTSDPKGFVASRQVGSKVVDTHPVSASNKSAIGTVTNMEYTGHIQGTEPVLSGEKM